MLPPSPPLISPPENLNYVVLITQFMTHFTRPQFMFQWISVAPPAVWICAQQFLGFVFSDFGFIVLVSLTIYFPIGFVSPPQFPIFATTRLVAKRSRNKLLSDCATALFVLKGFNPAGWQPGIDNCCSTDSQFHKLLGNWTKPLFFCRSFIYSCRRAWGRLQKRPF